MNVRRAATRLACWTCLAWLTAAAAVAAERLVLVNELADDQESELVTVWIDDAKLGELAVDRRRPRATLALPVSAPLHRYRLEGETVIDGERYRIAGGGLIVHTDRMDDIAERSATAVDAVAAYRTLLAEIRKAAPEADLADLELTPGPRADAAAVDAAERRLKVTLPPGYRRLVTEQGAFRLGAPDLVTGGVLAPAELATAVEFYGRRMREDGWDDVEEEERRIRRRFPRAAKDVVIDWFELDEPSVVVAGGRCKAGETSFALPGADFDLLGTEADGNDLLELIDYDYIMGEPQCMSYDRLLAYSLHDHLLAMGDTALFVRTADTETVDLVRDELDAEGRRLWMGLGTAE